MIYLAADIGGTKTILAAAKHEQGCLHYLAQQHYASQSFAGIEPILQDFQHRLATNEPIAAACFAIAGPIHAGHSLLTNLHWDISQQALSETLACAKIQMINDLEAIGYGLFALAASDIEPIYAAQPLTKALRAVIGVGTGLGLAYMLPAGHAWQSIATEGGHSHFAACESWQIGLLQHYIPQFGRVSNERFISGQGIVHIFNYLCHLGHLPSKELTHQLQQQDPAAAIAQFALQEKDAIAVMTMQWFSQLLGQFVGDVALWSIPRGGIYLCGGVMAKNPQVLDQKHFIAGVHHKGRMQGMVKNFPIYLVKDQHAAIKGALNQALNMAPPELPSFR